MQLLVSFQLFELQVQLRHLLPQVSLSYLLEDMVGKDWNERHKCYGDRGVPNCKLISSRMIDMVSGTNQDDQV